MLTMADLLLTGISRLNKGLHYDMHARHKLPPYSNSYIGKNIAVDILTIGHH